MGNHVIGQLVGKLLNGRLLARHNLLVLVLQLGHSLRTATTRRLVSCHVYGLDVRELLNYVQCHDHLNRRAVGVGDNVARCIERILGIDLGYNQGHILIHTEG